MAKAIETALTKGAVENQAFIKRFIEAKAVPTEITVKGQIGLTGEARRYLFIGEQFEKWRNSQMNNKNSAAPAQDFP